MFTPIRQVQAEISSRPYPGFPQPNELMRVASQMIKCPSCGGVFDERGGKKPLTAS